MMKAEFFSPNFNKKKDIGFIFLSRAIFVVHDNAVLSVFIIIET